MQHNVENIISKIVKKISTLFYYKKICANVTLDMIELLKPEKRLIKRYILHIEWMNTKQILHLNVLLLQSSIFLI